MGEPHLPNSLGRKINAIICATKKKILVQSFLPHVKGVISLISFLFVNTTWLHVIF